MLYNIAWQGVNTRDVACAAGVSRVFTGSPVTGGDAVKVTNNGKEFSSYT